MAQLTGGQALVKSVVAHGVDTIFGLPGVQLDWFFNALHDEGNTIRVLNSRHEQGVAYMAHGYAQSTGRVGAYAVVPGPGVLNTTAALSTSYAANVPVLCLTGQIPEAYIGRGFGMLHEIPDQLGMLRGLTKWADRIDHVVDAPAKVAEAFRQLNTGRRRPVALEMALDLLAQKNEVTLPGPVAEYARPALDEDAIAKAAKLLGEAQNPLIFAGSGVFGAETALKELAEMLQAPVVQNRTGRGALDSRHPLSVTALAGHRLWAKADVVLAVGSRLQVPRMNWGTDRDLKIIHVELDGAELKRVGTPDVAIVADSRDALPALVDAVAKTNRARDSRDDEMAALDGEVQALLQEHLAPQMRWLKVLREGLDEDGIFADELTQVGYVGRIDMPIYKPRTFLTSGYQGTLGSGYPTAIGAKVANPQRQVLSINGDGGFMYNVQEVATAVKYNIPVVAVVFADGAFGNVKRMQKELYDNRTIATDLRNPDFVGLAESFGAAGYRAETPGQLADTLSDAFRQNVPALIEVPMPEMPDPWKWLIPGRVRGGRA